MFNLYQYQSRQEKKIKKNVEQDSQQRKHDFRLKLRQTLTDRFNQRLSLYIKQTDKTENNDSTNQPQTDSRQENTITRMSFKRQSQEEVVSCHRRANKYQAYKYIIRDRHKSKELFGDFNCPNPNKQTLVTSIKERLLLQQSQWCKQQLNKTIETENKKYWKSIQQVTMNLPTLERAYHLQSEAQEKKEICNFLIKQTQCQGNCYMMLNKYYRNTKKHNELIIFYQIMQSHKSEKSQQDYISKAESQFLNTYLLHIIGEFKQYITNSELESRLNLNVKKVNYEKLVEQKKLAIINPQNCFFAVKDFKLNDLLICIKNIIQKYDFNDEESTIDIKAQSPASRRRLFQSVITTSFSGDLPVSKISSWIPLNSDDSICQQQINKGQIILFLIKIKTNSSVLQQLTEIHKHEMEQLQHKYKNYLKEFNSKIVTILFVNGDVNYNYDHLNIPCFFISKQNLLYHFFKNQHMRDQEAITESMITTYNLNRISQSRLKSAQWSVEYQNIRKEKQKENMIYFSAGTLIILFSSLAIYRNKK